MVRTWINLDNNLGGFMKKIFENLKIRNTHIENRICVPPMVCRKFCDETGYVTEDNINHYSKIAKGGCGLIIVEATAINKEGKLAFTQLGLWEDAQIAGHKKLVDECHKENVPVLLQVHHAGVMGVADKLVSASKYTLGENKARELEQDEIIEIENEFLDTALRAEKAGYDGIEIHGAHSYLLTQFLNERVNKRDDAYGQDKMLIVKNIFRKIREKTNNDFIIGIRLGAYEPTLEDGIIYAKKIEEIGFDFINVSFGFMQEMEDSTPTDFPFSSHIYGASQIKKEVNIPVFAVNGIKSKEQAQNILDLTDVDMLCIGRGVLVNYNWANDAKNNKDVGKCVECPSCFWRGGRSDCPGKSLFSKNV